MKNTSENIKNGIDKQHNKIPNLILTPPEGGVLPEKLGGGVRPASQNPYPIYDQNLRNSLPYLWSDP